MKVNPYNKGLYQSTLYQKSERKKSAIMENIRKNSVDYSKEKRDSSLNQSKNVISRIKKLEKKEEMSKNEEDNNISKKIFASDHIYNDSMKLIFHGVNIKPIKENSNLNSTNLEEDNNELDGGFILKRSEKIRYSYIQKLVTKDFILPRNNKKKIYNSLIIFDWDDTLFPTSFLARNKYFSDKNIFSTKKDEKVLKKIEKLEQSVIDLINISLTKGEVYIITNAVIGWVEFTSKQFYSNFYKILDKIKIISARGEWENIFPNNIQEWKIQTFSNLRNNFNNKLVTNIICLGDSMLEIEAGKILAKFFKEAFIKTVKFKEDPKIDELNKQLILVKNQFNAIHSSIKNLTIRVEKRKTNENENNY
jgi:hypothetical protein